MGCTAHVLFGSRRNNQGCQSASTTNAMTRTPSKKVRTAEVMERPLAPDCAATDAAAAPVPLAFEIASQQQRSSDATCRPWHAPEQQQQAIEPARLKGEAACCGFAAAAAARPGRCLLRGGGRCGAARLDVG